MKKLLLISTITASILYGTNGDLMVGHGPKSVGMAGIGIAIGHGAESALTNPAMISSVKDSEVSVSFTTFTPTVNFSSNAQANAMSKQQGGAYPHQSKLTYGKSDTSSALIPDVSYAKRVTPSMIIGLTVNGTAGLGADYNKRNHSGAFNMQTSLQIMKVGLPVAYTIPNTKLTVGVEPILQYSKLNTNYRTQQGMSQNKESDSVNYGVQVGSAYKHKGLTVGATYQSKIKAKYKGNISNAVKDFGIKSIKSGDNLDQPAEAGVGVSYKYKNNQIAVDYKKIEWSKAKGYKDFGWKDQDVIAVGYEYSHPEFKLRAGYNYAKTPLREKNAQAQGTEGYENSAINFFNLSGFPATIEEHYTVGADYKITDSLDLNLAYVYSPTVKTSYDTTGMTKGMIMQGAMAQGANMQQAQQASKNAKDSSANVEHTQQALIVGINYKFQ